ncbi:MAG: ABC transporter permease [Clostridia bacterium]|nr:ABC transporter permease [Clostridia bacterium]
MSDSLKVAIWEIKRNLTNKTFIISILLTPILMIVFGGLPTFLGELEFKKTNTIYVIDQVGIYDQIEKEMDSPNIKLINYQGDEEELKQKITGKQNTGYLVLDSSTLEQMQITLYNGDEGELNVEQLKNALNNILKEHQMRKLGMADQDIDKVMRDYSFSMQSLVSKDMDTYKKIIPAVFSMIILISVFITGSMTMQSSLQEKKDRMIEVLISSISPYSLMKGKIIGYFVLGILQVLIWMVMVIPVVQLVFKIPVLQYIFTKDMPLMLFFALMGYLMYSSLYVGIGATMDDVQSAGNFQGIIMIIPMLPIMLVGAIMTSPNGIIAKVGSFFPLTSPGVMLLRMAIVSHIPLWEILLSASLIVLATILIARMAGKIFKTGMLMYGKSATPSEILKWLKY